MSRNGNRRMTVRIILKRPLVFIDFETTGVDVEKDRIVEIGFVKYVGDFKMFDSIHEKVDPTIPIPPEATAVHGISDADVAGKPTFKELSALVLDFIAGCDIAGYNILSFDAPLLNNELLRARYAWDYTDVSFVDACVIARRKEPRDLTWARKFYCGAEHEGAHGALADSKASAFVLQAQIERYADVPQTIEELAKYSNYDKAIADLSGKFKITESGEIVFGFGKHRDKLARDEKDYLRWMLNADFAPDTKAVARKALGL